MARDAEVWCTTEAWPAADFTDSAALKTASLLSDFEDEVEVLPKHFVQSGRDEL